jgi:sigma-E factor negative regulatory protein RseC
MNFKTSSLLKATFLVYVLPILFLILGAGLGYKLGSHFDTSLSASSAICGFLFFFIAVWLMKRQANALAHKEDYQPKIVKILK